MAPTLTFEVPPEVDGLRLDKALALMLEVSRSVARELVDLGVQIDGVSAKPNTKVHTGGVIVAPRPVPPEELQPEPVDFEVLYEDEHVLVVNKPAGIVVHPGAGQSSGTLAAGLLHRFPEVKGVGMPGRWGLVHRLDRDTSGALLVARTKESFEYLRATLQAREIRREYLTLVLGTLHPPTGTIEAAIGRDPSVPTRRAATIDGKFARTHYRVIKNYENSGVALAAVLLETGRTHQIRVHFLAIDHPVIGDPIYNQMPSEVHSPRIFLHAGRLTFLSLIHI